MATAKCADDPEQNLLQPKSYRRPKQLCEKSPKINLFITFTILITDKSDIYLALFPYPSKEISKKVKEKEIINFTDTLYL